MAKRVIETISSETAPTAASAHAVPSGTHRRTYQWHSQAANAAKSLLKPSSAARAIDAGATQIERVDRLVQLIGRNLGMQLDAVDAIVETVDRKLEGNRQQAA